MPSKAKKLPKIEADKRALEKQFERPYVACALKNPILVKPKPNATPYTGVRLWPNTFYRDVQNWTARATGITEFILLNMELIDAQTVAR